MSDAAMAKEELFYTYAGYKEWELAPGERYELIDGVAYAMAAPNAYHQAILMELSRQTANYLHGKPCKVYPAPYDVRLFYEEDESDDTVVQPDITVVCDARKRGPEGCRGSPDLVVEIVSLSNTADEMERKFELYCRAGVREYWVVYPKTKSLHVHLFENSAITTRIYGTKDTVRVNSLPGLEIALEPVFAE
ncbi:MAG: Uma2 family endonuclease [Treponema sp.]|jgi:Uma2 family endonuclease|nr:Uma2 family endonuclease [Treponema sp.]